MSSLTKLLMSDVNKIFKALADPTRRELFHLLVVAGIAMPITELSSQFNITRQGVTKHIKVLSEAGMINLTESGRETLCEANLSSLKTVQDWLLFYYRFWDESLNKLEKHLLKKGK